MTQTCENLKTQLVDMKGKGLSDKAKLVAILEACGMTDLGELQDILECGSSTLRTARAALKNERSKSSAARNQAPEIEQSARNQAVALEIKRQNSSDPSCARANTELPTEVSSYQEVKNISSVPAETEHTPKPPKSKFARRRFAYTREFEEFWGSYPNIGNSSKSKAFESWRHLLPAEHLLAADGLMHLTAYCRANPKYTCMHVTTYLNERRWEAYETPAQRLAAKPQKPAEPEWMKRQRLEAEVLAINGMAA